MVNRNMVESVESTKVICPITSKITTIGNESCDIVVNSDDVTDKYAYIEMDEHQSILILRDLNTTDGTYVNDVLMRNSSVMLRPGDQVRFGTSPVIYEFKFALPNVSCTYSPSMVDYASGPVQPIVKSTMDEIKIAENHDGEKSESCKKLRKEVAFKLDNATDSSNISRSTSSKNISNCAGNSRTKMMGDMQSEIFRLSSMMELCVQKDKLFDYIVKRLEWLCMSSSSDGKDSTRPSNKNPKRHENCFKPSSEVRRRAASDPRDPILLGARVDMRNSSKAWGQLRKQRQILTELLDQLQKDIVDKNAEVKRILQEGKQLRLLLDEKTTADRALELQKESCRILEKQTSDEFVAALRRDLLDAKNQCSALEKRADKAERALNASNSELRRVQCREVELKQKIEELQSELVRLEKQDRNALEAKENLVQQYENFRTDIFKNLCALRSKVGYPGSTVDFCSMASSHQGIYLDPQETDDHSLCADVRQLDQRNNANIGEVENQEIVRMLQKVSEQISTLQHRIYQLEHEKNNSNVHRLQPAINDLVKKLKAIEETPDVLSEKWKKNLTKLRELRIEDSGLEYIKESFEGYFGQTIEVCHSIEEFLKGTYTGNISERPLNLTRWTQKLIEAGTKMRNDRDKMVKLLAEKEKFTETEISKMKESLEKDHQQRLDESIATKQEECAALQTTLQKETERYEKMLAVKQAIIEELEDKMQRLSQADNAKQLGTKLDQKVSELAKLQNELDQLNATIPSIREETEKQCEQKWSNEIEGYREQTKQHARTICVMEDRLLKVVKQNEETRDELQQLYRKYAELEKENQEIRGKLAGDQRDLDPPCPKFTSEVANMKSQLAERDATIAALQRDLLGAKAHLSDMRGEISETEKEEAEKANKRAARFSDELAKSRTELGRMKKANHKMKRILNEKENKVEELSGKLIELQTTLKDERAQVAKLQNEINQLRSKEQEQCSKVPPLEQAWAQLSAVGATCREERHLEIITKQKEALAQLRRRLNMSLNAKSNCTRLPKTPDRKLESRQDTHWARKFCSSRHGTPYSGDQTMTEDSDVPGGNCCSPEWLEPGMNSLQVSEKSYLDLINYITEEHQMHVLPNQRSLLYSDYDEQNHVRAERDSMLKLAAHRLEGHNGSDEKQNVTRGGETSGAKDNDNRFPREAHRTEQEKPQGKPSGTGVKSGVMPVPITPAKPTRTSELRKQQRKNNEEPKTKEKPKKEKQRRRKMEGGTMKIQELDRDQQSHTAKEGTTRATEDVRRQNTL